MEEIFYSPQNFKLLQENIKKNPNNIINSYDTNKLNELIISSMDYVWSNINENEIKKLKPNKAIYLLNNEIINNLLKIIKNENGLIEQSKIKNQYEYNIDNVSKNNYQNNIQNDFIDTNVFNLRSPTNFIDLPMAQESNKKNINIDQIMNNLTLERDKLNPVVNNIDLSEKDYNNGFDDVQNIYNTKINERKTDINIIDPIESNLSSMNYDEINYNQKETNINDLLNNNINSNNINSIKIDNNINTNIDANDINNYNNKEINKIRDLSINKLRDTPEIINKITNEPKDIYKETFEQKIIDDVNYINNQNPVILPPKNNLIEKVHYITIDSNNRDLEIYPSPVNFQLQFSPSSDSKTINKLIDNNNNVIFKETIINYGYRGATIGRNYENLYDIKCLNLLLPLAPNSIILNKTSSKSNPKVVFENNVLSNPYLLLNIDELTGPYEGSNSISTKSFAKLIPNPASGFGNNMYNDGLRYLNLTTMDYDETHKYDPTTLARLDKITLNLINKHGLQYFVGIDKLYVQYIAPNNNCIKITVNKKLIENKHLNNNLCNFDSGFFDTLCNSNNQNDPFKNPVIKFTGIRNGDRLYFYNTTPNINNIIYFEKIIRIYTFVEENNFIKMSCLIEPIDNLIDQIDYYNNKNIQSNKLDFLNFSNIFNDVKDIYIYIQINDGIKNEDHFLKLIKIIDNNEIIIEKYKNYDPNKNIKIFKFGFAYKNNKGEQSDNPNSLFFRGGVKVLEASENGMELTINVNKDNINNICDKFKTNDIFFIQDKLQLSYTFKITELIKDNKLIESRLA